MSSHKYLNLEDLWDIRIRHSIKNWLARKHPPAESRERLLRAAARKAKPQLPWIEALLLRNWSRSQQSYTMLSFERFAQATAYSLQVGVLIL
jgi:hypothetical protein